MYVKIYRYYNFKIEKSKEKFKKSRNLLHTLIVQNAIRLTIFLQWTFYKLMQPKHIHANKLFKQIVIV